MKEVTIANPPGRLKEIELPSVGGSKIVMIFSPLAWMGLDFKG
jgi:hypothetical protein